MKQFNEYLISKSRPNCDVNTNVTVERWVTKYKDFLDQLKCTIAKEVNFEEDLQNPGEYVITKVPNGFMYRYTTLRITVKTGKESYVKFIFRYKDRVLCDLLYVKDKDTPAFHYANDSESLSEINKLLSIINLKLTC